MSDKDSSANFFTRIVHDRMDIIADYVKDRKTLDLGVVDSRRKKHATSDRLEKLPNLLHSRICEINPDTVGVDIDEEGVEILNKRGHNTIVADVHHMDLGEKFDTIVAGEIIEHLPNPGLFLDNIYKHLTDDGVAIISTPNPFNAKQSWKIWRYNRPSVHEEHTCWLDPMTIKCLCGYSNLEIVAGYWVQPKGTVLKTWKRFFRNYFCDTLMVVVKKAG